MIISAELINGFGFGVEYFNDEYYGKGFMVEFLFFRFLVQLEDK